MIYLVELSITQQVLVHHESTIRSPDSCIFLSRSKVAPTFQINLRDVWTDATKGRRPAALGAATGTNTSQTDSSKTRFLLLTAFNVICR